MCLFECYLVVALPFVSFTSRLDAFMSYVKHAELPCC